MLTRRSIVEYSVHGDAGAGAFTGGTVVDSMLFSGSNQLSANLVETILSRLPICLDSQGLNPRAISVVGTDIVSAATIYATMDWQEIIYPCTCSRKDIQAAVRAPHAADDDEPLYPGTCRSKFASGGHIPDSAVNWRFRVPDGEVIAFTDGNFGLQRFVAGSDFGDFVVWRHDDVPAYQLAVVVDDAAMKITEVVRGADLLKSTARQLLLYRALGLQPPQFFHCPLLTDETGVRLAKRHDALSLRTLNQRGLNPPELRSDWAACWGTSNSGVVARDSRE